MTCQTALHDRSFDWIVLEMPEFKERAKRRAFNRWLTEGEFAEYKRLKSVSRSEKWLVARYGAKFLAKKFFDENLAMKDIEISKSKTGRPFIKIKGIRKKLSISISHSGTMTAIAISNGLVGVDIEKIRHISLKAKNYFLTGNEVWAKSKKEAVIAWTLKEALFKANGKGIFNPRNLEIIKSGNKYIHDDFMINSVIIKDYVISFALR